MKSLIAVCLLFFSLIFPSRAAQVCAGNVCAIVPDAVAAFDGERAYRDLVKQCEFGPRVPGARAHEQCAEWLAGQLRQSADSVVTQKFTVKVRGKTLRLTNIIATFNPKGKGSALLCAHWDTRPRAEKDPDPSRRASPIPGANDGASGVAVLLEVARVLKLHPPGRKVTIVLFDGEDWGTELPDMLLGSRYFAAHYRGERPEFAILLDMVGDKNLRIPQEAQSLRRAPEVVRRMWAAAERVCSTAFVRERGPLLMDDHIPLLNRGIRCIDVIDFTYPYWHTTADTPDKCSPDSLAQVGRAVLEMVR